MLLLQKATTPASGYHEPGKQDSGSQREEPLDDGHWEEEQEELVIQAGDAFLNVEYVVLAFSLKGFQ